MEDLNDIYDKGTSYEDGHDPEPKGLRGGTFDPPSDFDYARSSQYDPAKYQAHMEEGLYEQKGDPDARLGELQPALDKWGNFAVRTVAKIGTGFIEGLGYLGELASFGDDRDYSNPMIEAAISMNESLDANLPLYRKSRDTWAMGDLSWWLGNAEGLISSVASFALQGAGIAKVAGLLGKSARAMNAGRKVLGAVNQTERTLTAGGLAYVEGAMSGNRVFKQTYETQLMNKLNAGMDYEQAEKEARHTAAQSAATTVQLNTILNTGLNMFSVLPFFKHGVDDAVEGFAKKNFRQLPGEELEASISRMRGYEFNALKGKLLKREGAAVMGREAVFEGTEELTNQFAEATGMDLGKEGKSKGFFEQLNELSHYFDKTMNQEGALNFVLGAIGGPATQAVTTNLPIHSGLKYDKDGNVMTTLDEDGQQVAETKRYTTRTLNEFGTQQVFKNIQQQLMADFTYLNKVRNELETAVKAGDKEKVAELKHDLFNIGASHAVRMGMADNLTQSFQAIHDLDNDTSEREQLIPKIEELKQAIAAVPEEEAVEMKAQLAKMVAVYNGLSDESEAMRTGFAKDATDNRYKEQALEAIQDIKELEKMHKEIFTTYNKMRDVLPSDKRIPELVDFLFNRKSSMYFLEKRIREAEGALLNEELDLGDVDAEAFNTEGSKYNSDIKSYEGLLKRIAADEDLLENSLRAKDIDGINKLIKKFSRIGVSEKDVPAAISGIRSALARQRSVAEKYITDREAFLFESVGYTSWLAKEGMDPAVLSREENQAKFDQYRQKVQKDAYMNPIIAQRKIQILDGKRLLSESQEQYSKLTKEKGVKSFLSKYENWRKELEEKYAEEKSNKEHEKVLSETDAKLKKQLAETNNHDLAQRYAAELNEVRQDIIHYNEIAEEYREELEAHIEKNYFDSLLYKDGKTSKTLQKFIDGIQQAQDNLAKALTRQARLETLYTKVQQDIAAAAEEAPAEVVAKTEPDPSLVNEEEAPPPPSTEAVVEETPTADKKADIERRLGIKLPTKNTALPVSSKTWGDTKSLATQISSELKGVVERDVSMQEWLDKGYGRQLATWTDETIIEFLEVADIERRRQEELDKYSHAFTIKSITYKYRDDINDGEIVTVRVDTKADGSVHVITYHEGEVINREIVKNKERIADIKGLIGARGTVSELQEDGTYSGYKTKENPIIEEVENSVNESKKSKEINAKYDAEIAALPKQEAKPTVSKDKKADIERRRQAEKNSIREIPKKKGLLGKFQNAIVPEKYEYEYIHKKDESSEEFTTTKLTYTREEAEKQIKEKYDAELAALGETAVTIAPNVQESFDAEVQELLAAYKYELIGLDTSELKQVHAQEAYVTDTGMYSLDALKGIANGVQIMQALINLHTAMGNWVTLVTEPEQVPEPIVVPPIDVSAGLVLVSSEPQDHIEDTVQGLSIHVNALEEADTSSHTGNKRENTASSVANSTLGYTNIRNDEKKTFGMVSILNDLNRLAEVLLDPKELLYGTELTVQVDPDYSGQILFDRKDVYTDEGKTVTKTYNPTEHFNEDGTVKPDAFGEVPIVIRRKSDNLVIGYVHRGGWISSSYTESGADPDSARNTAEVTLEYDSEGNVIEVDNLSKQERAIAAIRNAIIQKWNENRSGINTKVISKGAGVKILNFTMTGSGTLNAQGRKVVWAPARAHDPTKSLIPGNVRIGILQVNGEVQVGTNQFVKEPLSMPTNMLALANIPVLVLPTANGNYTPAILKGKKLWSADEKESSGDGPVNSIARIIEMYLDSANQGEDITKLLKNISVTKTGTPTGLSHDPSTVQGLRGFIEQFWTHTTKFSESDLQYNPNTKNKTPRWLLQVAAQKDGELKGTISIGRTQSNRAPIVARLSGGKLNREFVEALKEMLNERHRIITYSRAENGIVGLNSNSAFVYPQADKTGNWRFTEYPNYNEYVKAFSFTSVYGRNQLSNGDYTYVANPDIQFDTTPFGLTEMPTYTEEEMDLERVDESGEEINIDESDFLFYNVNLVTPTSEIGYVEDSKEVTEANLTELLNFTPISHRNGKTVGQVLQELNLSKVNQLAPGYNPFYRC